MSSPLPHISVEEMASKLGLPHHLILFWQKKFNCFRMVLRPGEGQLISTADAPLVAGIYTLLQNEGCTLRDVQRLLKQRGISHVASFGITLVAGSEKFNGQMPMDMNYGTGHAPLRFDEDDTDLDTDLAAQRTLSRPSASMPPLPDSHGTASGRPTLGSGLHQSSLGARYIPTPPVDTEERVSIFDIATGAQPTPSIATGKATVSSSDNVEELLRERTQAAVTGDHALRNRVNTATNALTSYENRADIIDMVAPQKMRQAVQGLSHTLQKLDTLELELEELETALKESLECMGFSGFRNAYKEYDERRFELDASVL